ncbi:hypothetical protein GCM10023185_02140 [Hymenobacter saemangeumensis]|uniref:Uncharacterized protein n=1 Tax=Hymenobacter saemangeumensis TaxID=1084522 RepID=A0ABP8HYD1_9BACT
MLLLVVAGLIGPGNRCQAQDQNRPFIKIAHIGAEESPVVGAFISTRASALDEGLALVPGYRVEPVFVVSKNEFAALLRLVRRYATTARPAVAPAGHGTFRCTFSDGKGAEGQLIAPKDEALHFITELSALVDTFEAANRKSPELWNALKDLRFRLAN